MKAKVRKIKKQVAVEQVEYSKSIFNSQTFWCATIMAMIPLCGIVYDGAIKGYNVVHATILPGILASYLGVIQGRLKANESLPLYTPNGLPGANKEDFLPVMEEGYDSDESNVISYYIPEK